MATPPHPPGDPLDDHGDRQVPAGSVDLAVNVWGPTPGWLLEALRALDPLGYPDPAAALEAVAARHGVAPTECLVLNGAAEAFWLVAQALRPRLAACVHPSFTAPEAALRSAGVPVHRVVRDADAGFGLDPAAVPEAADLVVLGRPDNPTGRLEPLETLSALARPGRVLLVDEAFADFLPDGGSVYGAGIPGLVCVRSLTKLWGLAGLRVGYLLGGPDLVARLASARQPWPVNTLALHATAVLARAEGERRERAEAVTGARAALVARLEGLPVEVWESPANFLLLRSAVPDLRDRLLDRGFAVRRCDSFPGLDAGFVRVAVRPEEAVRDRFVEALSDALRGATGDQRAGDRRAVDQPVGAQRVHAARAARPGRTLVLGGARSGKSRHAQHLLADETDVVYVAPGPVPDGLDADWAARVAAHRRDRPATWTTRETVDVAGVLAEEERPVLVDCLATWLAGTMSEVGAWDSADGETGWEALLDAEVDRLVAAWRSTRARVVAVSNEVGSGVVPATRAGVLFRDALGRVNQRLAEECDDVRLVVAGRVLRLGEERA